MLREMTLRQWPLMLGVMSNLLLGACASVLPGPPRITHPQSAYEEVPYPPPAALVEVVPPSPASLSVWLDGDWRWQGKFYLWRRGGWVDVPSGSYFADWQSYYTGEGRLMFARSAWYTLDRTRIRGPKIRSAASSLPSEAHSEFQATR